MKKKETKNPIQLDSLSWCIRIYVCAYTLATKIREEGRWWEGGLGEGEEEEEAKDGEGGEEENG